MVEKSRRAGRLNESRVYGDVLEGHCLTAVVAVGHQAAEALVVVLVAYVEHYGAIGELHSLMEKREGVNRSTR